MLFCNADCSKNTADCHSTFRVNNASNKAIYFSPVFDSSFSKLNYPPGLAPESQKCNSTEVKLYNRHGCYESDIDYFGKLYIFIFDADVIETTPWEVIKQNRLFLKRLDLTKDQLYNSGWIISYP